MLFYIDGNGYTSVHITTHLFFPAKRHRWILLGGAYYESFYGSIDELSIYDQALSTSEIQAIYNAGSAGKCATFESAPSIVLQPNNQTIIVGDQVSFSVTATSFGPEGYQWSLDRTNIDGATNSVLALANVQFDQAGSYAVTVTNGYGPRRVQMPCSLFSRHSAFPRPLALSVGGGRRTTPLTGSAAITATLLAIRMSLDVAPSYAIDYGAGKVGQAFIFDGFGLRWSCKAQKTCSRRISALNAGLSETRRCQRWKAPGQDISLDSEAEGSVLAFMMTGRCF